jgi:hypothetical protein
VAVVSPGAASPAPTAPRNDFDPAPVEGPDGLSVTDLGRPPIWSLPGVVPAPAPPALRPVNNDAPGAAVREAMAANDSAHGVGPTGGPDLASAIADAARGPEAPRVGRATFEVRVDKRGHAMGVSLRNAAAGDARGWEAVATKAAASLQGRTFPLGPAFARGASVSVDVIAAMALPSGPTRWISPMRVLNGESKPVQMPRSPDDVSNAGSYFKVPEKSGMVRIVDFDVTNFGAKERRGVRATFQVTPVY